MENKTIHGVLMTDGIRDEAGAEKIEKALRKETGVIQAKALMQSSNIYLTYEPEKVSLEKLSDIVEGLGFRIKNRQGRSKNGSAGRSVDSNNTNKDTIEEKKDTTALVMVIKGMSCGACEVKLEEGLNKLKGVSKAKVSYKNANAVITYNPKLISRLDMEAEIERLGYHAVNQKSEENVKEEKNGINTLLGIGMLVLAVILIQNNTGLFQLVPQINQNMGYGILFVIGILTSLHCVAMCGGINLSQCVSYGSADSSATGILKYTPSLLYNAGRVVSYTLIGGIVGALGSVVSISGTARGVVALAAGIFMVIMGLNMLNIFPALRKIVPGMPKIFRKKLVGSGKGKGPFYIGLLNGLMPCGPLQSMQLYALGTGSFMAGALSMLLFSLGTVPLMFGFGAIAGLLNSKYTKKMMKASAALVITLGIIMLNRGLSLSGIDLVRASNTVDAGNTARVEENVQVITTKLQPGGYEPIVVQKGVPVKWTIQAEQKDLNGCNETIVIPAYNIEVTLKEGDNLIEFTPKETGNIPYSCWMGMIRSNIQVVDSIQSASSGDTNNATLTTDAAAVDTNDTTGNSESAENTTDTANNVSESSAANETNTASAGDAENSQGLLGSAAASGGCCGVPPAGFEDGKIPTDNIAVAEVKDGKQEVTVTVDSNGYTPAVIVLQNGVDAKIKFEGKELTSCNSTVVFPEYQGQLDLSQQTETPWLTISGDFTFQCSMGMLHGYVKVVDDINNVDLDEIKSEVENYTPAAGSALGGCCGEDQE